MAGDPLSLALEHGYRVREAVDEAKRLWPDKAKDLTGEAVTRRAKDLASLMLSAGLVPTLTFYMAKVEDDNVYEAALKLLEGSRTNNVLEKIKDDLSGKEGAGYSIILAAVVKALESLYPQALGGGSPRSLKDLATRLKDMHEKRLDVKAESVLQPYLIELKKVLEALLGGGGG